MSGFLAGLRAFWTELRRRHLFRVVGVYAVVAWAAVQVADIVVPLLQLPAWTTMLVVLLAFLGLPIVLALAWAFESSPQPGRSGRWTASPSARGAQTVAATGMSRSVVAVLPFALRGTEEFAYLGEGMVDLLSAKLSCAGELRSVDPRALLSSGLRWNGSAIDPEQGRAVAERFGAGLFILGSILEVGGRLHIDAAVYEAYRELRLVTRTTVEGGANEVFELVDDVARRLLAEMTEGAAERLTRLAVTTTESFPALKAYLEGESEMRAMRRLPAIAAFGSAVQEDPSFALAWYRLGVAALWSGQLELSRDAVEQAVEHGERMAERDRQLLQAFRAFLRGQADEAERLYRAIVGRQPDDLEAWYQLAEVLFHYRPRRGGSIVDSRFAWQRVLALQPEHVSALIHLAAIAAREGDRGEVDSLAKRALGISPEGDAVVWMLALRACVLGDRAAREMAKAKVKECSDFAAARSIWYIALPSTNLDDVIDFGDHLTEPSRSAEVRAVGHVWLAYLELAQGRWRAAQGQLAKVKSLHPASAIAHRALLSMAPFLGVSDAELKAIRAGLAEWAAGAVAGSMTAGAYFTVHDNLYAQIRSYLLGLISARLGDGRAALRHAGELERSGGRTEAAELAADQVRSVRAVVAWKDGRPADALEFLEEARMSALFELTVASPFYSQAYERFLRAELLEAQGREEEALSWYGSFAEHSVYDLVYLGPSHSRCAEIHERLGRHAEATRHDRSFTGLWREPDPAFRPMLSAAEARLAAAEQGN